MILVTKMFFGDMLLQLFLLLVPLKISEILEKHLRIFPSKSTIFSEGNFMRKI